MDSTGRHGHFPATERAVTQFSSMFRRTSSFETYLKHLRWAHRFLHLRNDWDTDVVRQVCRGRSKCEAPRLVKLALQGAAVRSIVKQACLVGDREQAAMYAIARLFFCGCLPNAFR